MKDKTTAALLALFLGMFGIHRFYLRQPGLGILYFFLFFIGFISVVLGIIDAIVLLAMDQEEFDRRYNDQEGPGQHDRYRRRTARRDYQRQRSSTPTRRQRTPSRNTHVPERTRTNPYVQSGIKKYKDFELEEAIEDFIKGLEINPADVALHFNIACAYSLTEQADKALTHLDKAVELGFTDFDRIKTHDDLAFVRIQPEFEDYEGANFRLISKSDQPSDKETPQAMEPTDDKLLTQLKRLAELRDKGLITEHEFVEEKEKLMR
jgi:TM2 domain-containing membrane protein YozV